MATAVQQATVADTSSPAYLSSSVRRRKIQHTFRSPLPNEPFPLPDSHPAALARPVSSTTPPRATSASSFASLLPKISRIEKHSTSPQHHAWATSLPLYHPQGALARSLQPLDPIPLGLPPLPKRDSSPSSKHRHSSRDMSREHSPANLPPTVMEVAAVAAREVREMSRAVPAPTTASPKKKRGGAAAAAKRKRKDQDDADIVQPAKRSRVARKSTIVTPSPGPPPVFNRQESADSVMLAEEERPAVGRRSTRSKPAAPPRRASTVSEDASSGGGHNVVRQRKIKEPTPRVPSPAVFPMDEEVKTTVEPSQPPRRSRSKESKEEGEVSDEAKSS